MHETVLRRGAALAVAALVAAVVAAGSAGAQERSDTSGTGTTPSATVGPTTNTQLVDPGQGGVAGTGLGKSPPTGDAPGTGMSVKGPAGQDIDGLPHKP